jgi:excisionase family DNA binding protein
MNSTSKHRSQQSSNAKPRGVPRRSAAAPIHERLTLTIAEVAKLLGLSVNSVYVAANSGQLPARRVGSRWLISRAALEQWMNEPALGAPR